MENDFHRIVGAIKEIVVNTIRSLSLSDVEIGEVVSVDPLIIQTESKISLDASSIVLTKNTSLHSIDMSVDHLTENRAGGGGMAEYASHNHEYKGRKTYLVHNELLVGEKVILLRESGGQRYIAIDKFYNPNRGCKDR